MKLTLRILKLLSILLITVLVILFSAALLLEDKVAGIILKSANNNISTPFNYSALKLSFLKNFPKASLELKDVLVHSSTDFNLKSFPGINTDTLLSARYVTLEFRVTDIIKGIYNIERISARIGKINLFTDKNGHVNYDLSLKNESSGSSNFTIDLKRINLNRIELLYNNRATEIITVGLIKNGRFQSRISNDKIDFTAVADMEIRRIQIYNITITKSIPVSLDLDLQSSNNGILFRKGTLSMQNYDFGLTGSVSSDNILDLDLKGNNIDIAKIRNYLPAEYLGYISEYNPSGVLIIESRIKGLLTRTSNPHVEIDWLLSNGNISYGKSDLKISALSFAGSFSNGKKNRLETCSVSINNLKAKLGSAEYTGSATLSGFDHPKVALDLKGKLVPAELREFFDLQDISAADGSVELALKIEGFLPQKEKYTFTDFFDLKPEAILDFNSFSIGLKNNRTQLTNVNGVLSIDSSVRVRNFRFIYKGQNIKIDGEFRNLPDWLEGRPVSLIAKSNVSISKVTPELFAGSKLSADSSSKSAIKFPDNLILDINFNIDSLRYNTFSSSEIAGTLNYKPGLLTFKSLRMEALNGIISGNGFVVQNKNKSLIARGVFDVKDIDVKNAFKTFNNFGQSFLKAENIAGKISGSLSVLIPMDSVFNPKINLISAEGKYLLTNGSLINFEPVKQLSSFIELSELENISFDKMENDFFIRTNILYLPQMDVKSSAADLSINGKHSFDNDYEYHIKMLLSEILSKKRNKNKNKVTEFGVVEDDGLGRTSLLLKIVNKGDNFKVGYDMKAAGNQVKNNIKTERKNLKSILNQEYGWFKNDSSEIKKPVEKKPRFRISWEESDSAQIPADPPDVKKKPFKRK